MRNFTVPTREEVSTENQSIFDNLKSNLGFVPNLYALFAKNETALNDYLALQNRKSTLKPKEREVINLVVSQTNNCNYCLAAHTALGKMRGFSDDEVLEIRVGDVTFDEKLNALAHFTKETTDNHGKPSAESLEKLFESGYTEANLVDIVMTIGDKIITNYLHSITEIPIDFPAAPELKSNAAKSS